MRTPRHLLLIVFALVGTAFAQSPSQMKQPNAGKSIEGYWQDTARRILFARGAPPGYVYGKWDSLDQGQTYPTAKAIRRSGSTYEVADLLYDDNEHNIKVVRASEDRIEFIRSLKFPACSMRHVCRVDADELFCSLENTCVEQGRSVVDWRGEERYARRALCERDGGRQAQGIPVKCR